MLASWKKKKLMTNLDSILKTRDITLLTKVHRVNGFSSSSRKTRLTDFSSSHVRMWELGHKECWAPKNWCFRTVMLEKSLESLLDSKEMKPVNPKGNQPWIFTWRIDAEGEAPILWLPDVKSWLTGKDPDVGEDWGQEEKEVTEDEMVGMASPTQWTWVWANSGR